jgi:hypothetical protein
MVPPARPRVTIKLRRRAKLARAQAKERLEQRLADERKRADLARGHAPVDTSLLAPDNSFDTPDFVSLGFYVDRPFTCKTCGKAEVWTGAQQKWWYETAKGNVWTTATMCRPCRRNEQARKATARQVHLEGLARKKRPA